MTRSAIHDILAAVSQGPSLHRLAQTLRDDEPAIIAAWRQAFERSPVRMPGPQLVERLAPHLSALLDGLALALASDPGPGGDGDSDGRTRDELRGAREAHALSPGAPGLRELEKNLSFIGATLATAALSSFDVAACVFALRDVVLERAQASAHPTLQRLFEWLALVAVDGFASAGVMAVRERMSALLEEATPVVLLAPRVPCAMLVGAPDANALAAIFDRLTVLAVTQDAPAVILDVSGLQQPQAPAVLASVARFVAHERVAGRVEMLVVGLDDLQASPWLQTLRELDCTMNRQERLRDAVQTALTRAGWALVPCAS
ncbi:hypothetical protein [Haliangium ochraceum]|uniref:STAS domain-containing protein n=1 Tax=Haliangium ochraceum (strain DSM 14365 / JCM 11303 / SMP-2) TaxID=502025 RepID=D0LIK5_HALO1|nr:hypothetical protein [Haliangium ochraceum]ACY18361.1 hypothetical protein Hoch_5886 [Haliangium ochraceum DSM 14365]